MPASTAAVVASSAALAASSSARDAAQRAECRTLLGAYQPNTATVGEMREYAACVRLIHGTGEPMTPVEAIAVKAAILLCFAGAIVGAFLGWRDDGPVMGAVGAVCGASLAAICLLALLLAVAGLAFVVGA